MNIAQAKAELMAIAGNEYHSISYTVDDHGNGHVRQTCKVYIHGRGSCEGPHWEDALAQLKSALSGRPTLSEDLPTSEDETKSKGKQQL